MTETAWVVTFAGLAVLVAAGSVSVAYIQLRNLARSAHLEGLKVLYAYFDDPGRRRLRKVIHAEITDDAPPMDPQSIPSHLGDAIELTATSLDVVGFLVDRKIVAEDIVMERYLEVIIPIWNKTKAYLLYRRSQKGRGWEHFEDLFGRADRYQRRRYPNLTFPGFTPMETASPNEEVEAATDSIDDS